MGALVAASIVFTLSLVYLRVAKAISYPGDVPRVGSRGVFGYILTAIRYAFNPDIVLAEGKKKFSGMPFAVPTLVGTLFFLGPEYVSVLQSSSDSEFNQAHAIYNLVQFKYTLGRPVVEGAYEIPAVRVDVSRALPSFLPELVEESAMAIDRALNPNSQSVKQHGVVVSVFDTVTLLIARVSGRVMFGTELCRNDDYIRAVVQCVENIPLLALTLNLTPAPLRSIVCSVVSMFGQRAAALKYLATYMSTYLKERESQGKRNVVAEFVIARAPRRETIEGLTFRMLTLVFASVHSSSIMLTQTLFELAVLPESDLDSIRTEISDALTSEGGWTPEALSKFRRLDSAMREIARIHMFVQSGMLRMCMKDYELGNGTWIPSGALIAMNLKDVHLNPEVYPDPESCNLFRFYESKSGQNGEFVSLDSHYLTFGAGSHACPGRYFANMELKAMLGHILLNYDIRLPPGVTQRPSDNIFNGFFIPDMKAQLVFTARKSNVSVI